MNFPESLELEITSRDRFQFELEGLSQVVFLLTRNADSVQFQTFLRQVPIMDQKFAAKIGESITVTFPPDVLSKIRADIAAEEKKKVAKVIITPTPNGGKATKISTATTPASAAAAASANNDRRRSNTSNSTRPVVQNPDQEKVGRSLSQRTIEMRGLKLPEMKWVSGNQVNHGKQAELYREIINSVFYPMSQPFRSDPLHLWNFYLYKANIAISLIAIDTNQESFKGAEGLEALKSRIYRHIFSMKNYENNVYKYDQVHAEENAKLPKSRQYVVKAVEGQQEQMAPTLFQPNFKKLLRIGIPANTSVSVLRLLHSCKSYANHLGVNFLLDKVESVPETTIRPRGQKPKAAPKAAAAATTTTATTTPVITIKKTQ